MSNERTPAFPTPGKVEIRDVPGSGGTKYEHKIPSKEGMALRDYFAAKIAAGDAASADGWGTGPDHIIEERVRLYYRIADIMLRVRDEPTGS